MSIRHILISLTAVAASLIMHSCKVDFSPNAQWKEIPVVYCVLDQDDDTVWARVQRCYLVDGNINTPASITDSINFPQGYLNVDLIALHGGSAADSMRMTYTTRTINTGHFANVDQPMYYYVPTRKLDSTCQYQLLITRAATGETMASATTQLISKTNSEILYVRRGRPLFAFYDEGETYNPEWNNLTNARRYEPIIRFYYSQHGDTLYKDLSCGSVLARRSNTQSIKYSRYQFLNDIQEAFDGDTEPKRFLKMVDIYITACNEDLNAYINSSISNALEQGNNTYTNIDGGLGVFASRRTHIYQQIDADSANNRGSLYEALGSLGIGF